MNHDEPQPAQLCARGCICKAKGIKPAPAMEGLIAQQACAGDGASYGRRRPLRFGSPLSYPEPARVRRDPRLDIGIQKPPTIHANDNCRSLCNLTACTQQQHTAGTAGSGA